MSQKYSQSYNVKEVLVSILLSIQYVEQQVFHVEQLEDRHMKFIV